MSLFHILWFHYDIACYVSVTLWYINSNDVKWQWWYHSKNLQNTSEIYTRFVLVKLFNDLQASSDVITTTRMYVSSSYMRDTIICLLSKAPVSLRWRHNERHSVSNHQPHHCLLNHLFRRISKKTSKIHVNGLCVGNWPVTCEFPAQIASNAENISIWWRHHILHLRELLNSNNRTRALGLQEFFDGRGRSGRSHRHQVDNLFNIWRLRFTGHV